MSPALRALVDAARRNRLLDPALAKRLSQAAAKVQDLAELAKFLAGPSGPGGQLAGRLGALLARPGIKYGDWQPLARIIDGTAGEAWIASNPGGQLGLLRVLPSGGISGDDRLEPSEARRRFLRQFEVCRQVDHPGIITLLGSGETSDGGLWFTIEHTESGDLSDLMRLYGGRLAEIQTLGIGGQIAGALAELERMQLVHRAITPAAIIVQADGTSKLGNLFQTRNSNTIDFTILGTTVRSEHDASWLPPESILDQGEWTIRSDVYSLGCVLFACLSGSPPFTGAAPEVMHSHVSVAPPDLRTLVPGIDGATADAIASCLAKDPIRRPQPALLRDVLLSTRARLTGRGETTGRNRDSDRSGSSNSTSDRIHVTSRSSRTSLATRRRKIHLAGDFADVPMNEVLQTLSRVKASGVLEMIDARGATEGLVVVDGDPVGLQASEAVLAELAERLADVPGLDLHRLRGRLAGQGTPEERLAALSNEGLIADEALAEERKAQLFDAITRRFLDQAGSFTFLGDDGASLAVTEAVIAGTQRPLRLNLNHVLMEAARLLDEWTALRRRLPGPWSIPILDPLKAASARSEHPYWPERAVLASIDGATPLESVIALGGSSPCAALRLIADLVERGDILFLTDEPLHARVESLIDQPLAAEPLARAAIAALPRSDRAALAFARCLTAVDPDHLERLSITPAPTSSAPTVNSAIVAGVSALTPAPTATIEGDPSLAYTGEWLALVSAPDGSGTAVHLFAADKQPEVQVGKLAKPPVLISLRKYPEQQFLSESQQLSRIHCNLTLDATGASLRDLGSANGTWCDGARLEANREFRLQPKRPHAVSVAQVIELQIRLELAAHDIPGPPVGTPPGRSTPSAVIVTRMGNRPELAYALVRHHVSMGGSGANVTLPGCPADALVHLARADGRWFWSSAPHALVWRPLVIGQPLAFGKTQMTPIAGDYGLYH